MAEQTTNALVTPSGTIADEVTANSTTAFDITWAEPDPPTSATFPLTFKGDADDGSDDAIFAVTAITGSAVTNGTWIKVGNQTVFPVGTEIDLSFTDEALRAVIAELIATHDGASPAHASATNLLHTTGAESKAGNLTLTDRLLHQNGSAAAPAIAPSARSTDGFYSPASNQIGVATDGVLRAAFTNNGLASFYPLALYTGLWQQTQNIGATLNVSTSTTPSVWVVTQATCTVNLPQVIWSTFPIEFLIDDRLNLLGTLTINAWNDGVFDFNDINGADGTYGAWTDGFGFSVGPFGAAATLTDTGGLWRMTSSKNDTGSGASGGWTIQKLATDLAY